ncbi:MAG TPA: LptA/OstA family protein [Candidatus Baltobacteraceae bacterium]|nr:LptA/OstA family protein [Candidatus Baltobacteraceae bacterium]
MIRSLFALLASVALLAPSPAPHKRAAQPAPRPAAAASSGAAFDLGVWTVHASSVDANFKTGSFNTPSKVYMTRAGGDVTADKANGNYKKQIVYLVGHVVMHDSSGNYGGLASAESARNNGPSTLTADKAEIDGQAKIYKAMGNVHYVQSDTVVDSDTGTLNDVTHDLFLQGNVHVTQGTRKIDANTVLYNTISGQAHAEGNVTMEFPGQFHRGIATPRPININIPKNPIVKPLGTAAPPAAP